MLKMKKVRGFCAGLGDLFMLMPSLIDTDITHLQLDTWSNVPGVLDLLKIVNPRIKYDFIDNICGNLHIVQNLFDVKFYTDHQNSYRNKLPRLPDEIISKIGF